MANDSLKITLFCGGTGTRLWPMSTPDRPKQFQPLIDGRSTFQIMVDSLKTAFSADDIFPVSPRKYIGLIVEQAPDIPLENIIVEPEARDTLGAVGFATVFLAKKFGDPIIASIWSDHLISNTEGFGQALKTAAKIANRDNKMVRVGVRPTYPSTGLGYMQVGKMVEKLDDMAVFDYVKHFEKPELKTAKKFMESWEYLWHIGYNVWHASLMMSFFEKYNKESFDILKKIETDEDMRSGSKGTLELYQKIPKMSVDFGVFEHLPPEQQIVISADLGWSDVGTWDVLKNELAKTEEENVSQGNVVAVEAHNNLLYSQDPNKTLAVIGVSGLVVVDTPEATLVVPQNRSQEVKKLVDKIKRD